MLSDLAIAQQATLQRIADLARDRWGLAPEHLEPYGHYKAKITPEGLAALQGRPDGKLVLVTAISPTPAGEGKTTTTVGLGDALHRIGRRAVICLREPSMGPVFGIKGGAAGGGHAQVVPMEDINLHFTGDFAAVAAAHNLLAALVDNHVHHGNELGLDVRRIAWRRAVDVNDRALREITIGLGGPANGYPREDGFDIVVASEVMAILCLCRDLVDLRERLGRIVVGHTRDGQPVTAAQLSAHGAMAALLKQAVQPNLVQTLEGNPALIHGGPFANIAHGCNSVIATRAALKLGEFAITEAGFGADLGAEKFIDIKCRSAGLTPDAAVLVATLRALKFHGGVDAKALDAADPAAVGRGLVNLERHLQNLRGAFGLPCVVALNHFEHDTAEEIAVLQRRCAELDVPLAVCRHWADGGAGALDLAHEVVRLCQRPAAAAPLYGDALPLWDKVHAVATRLYGAADIAAGPAVRRQIQALQDQGHGALPICVAKTPYSFSTDPALRGAPGGHVLDIRAVRLSAGAGFVVVICGDIMTMPGLPRTPAAHAIDIDADGRIVGLF